MNLLRRTTCSSLTTINQTWRSMWWITPLKQVSGLCKLTFYSVLKWTESNSCLTKKKNTCMWLLVSRKLHQNTSRGLWKVKVRAGWLIFLSSMNKTYCVILSIQVELAGQIHLALFPWASVISRVQFLFQTDFSLASSLTQKMVDSALSSSSTALCPKPCVGPGKGREECESADGCSRLGGRSGQREGRI